jgi:uncharacterized protein YutE (UPF0331/DUF86 family)
LADGPSIESRLGRLDGLLVELDAIRVAGRRAYDTSFGVRLGTQHALQLAIQCCIDIAGALAADVDGPSAETYAGYFDALRNDGLDAGLADRLKLAVGLRNVLVHDYLDLDEDIVWSSLDHLDDLRWFAAFALGRLDGA